MTLIRWKGGKWGFASYVLLCIAAYCGNEFVLPLFMGFDYFFGTIAVMMVICLFGMLPGLLTALLASLPLVENVGHPYVLIWGGLEAVFLGFFVRKRGYRNLVVLEAIYWPLVAGPLIWLTFTNVMGTEASAALLVVVRRLLNGVVNAIAASLIIQFTPLYRTAGVRRPVTTMRQLAFHVLAVVVLLPGIFAMAAYGREIRSRIETSASESLRISGNDIQQRLESVINTNLTILKALSRSVPKELDPRTQLGRFIAELVRSEYPEVFRVELYSADGTLAAGSPSELAENAPLAAMPYGEADSIIGYLRHQPGGECIVVMPEPEPMAVMGVSSPGVAGLGGYVLGAIRLSAISNVLTHTLQLESMVITLVDRKDMVICSTRDDVIFGRQFRMADRGGLEAIGDSLLQFFPTMNGYLPLMERWRISSYVLELPLRELSGWKLVIEMPLASLQTELSRSYLWLTALMLVYALGAMAFAFIAGHLLTVTLNKLSMVTTDLPQRLVEGGNIDWPESSVFEIQNLISNVKSMASALTQRFHEIRETNESLERRVGERTRELTRTLGQLRDSETRYRNLFEQSGVVMLILDPRTGRIHDCNPAALQYYGYELSELRAKLITDITNRSVDDLMECFEETRKKGRALFTAKHRLSDGSVHDVEIYSNPVMLGSAEYIMSLVYDVSERNRASRELQETKDYLDSLFRHANVPIAVWDAEFRITRFNPAFEQLTALPRAQLEGRELVSLFTEEYRETALSKMREAAQGRRWEDVEIPILRADGVPRVVLWNTACVGGDGNAAPLAIIVQGNDITTRIHALEALRASEERLALALEASSDALWDLDVESGSLYLGPRYASMVGCEQEDLPTSYMAWLQLLHHEDKVHVEAAIQEHIEGISPTINVTYRARIGEEQSWVWIQGRGKVVARDEEGKPRRVLGTHTDISDKVKVEDERKRLESQLNQAQKMDSVGRLAGGVAHDMNNMLSPIMGYTELLLEGIPANHPFRKPMTEVLKASERARNLTRQLLAFSRKQVLDVKQVNLNDVIRDFLGMLGRLIGEDIEIATLLDDAIPFIRADVSQLEQILLNFAVNARDAMPGGGRLTIETTPVTLDSAYVKNRPTIAPGHYALLMVSDTGCGMTAEVRRQVFEPFFTTKEKGKGTGLGLATVYGIVKQHEGDIWLYSEPGVGTTIKVFLPGIKDTDAHAPATAADHRIAREVRGSETILVVEDEDSVRRLVCDILMARGFFVLEASSPPEALRIANEMVDPIDLVVTDVVMPQMNGREMFRHLLERHPEARALYMSGYTENVIAHHGILEEGICFIGKPFTPGALAERVREALDARQNP